MYFTQIIQITEFQALALKISTEYYATKKALGLLYTIP